MFGWVLNTPLNTIKKKISDVSKLKLMTFSIFFSTINFSYQYLPEAKVYLEPSRTFYSEALLRNICLFLCKIHKKTPVLESHFNKVTGAYPATSLKERTPTQVFSDGFCEVLKTPFLKNTSRRLLLFYGKSILSIN